MSRKQFLWVLLNTAVVLFLIPLSMNGSISKKQESFSIRSHLISPVSDFFYSLYLPTSLKDALASEKAILSASNLNIKYQDSDAVSNDGDLLDSRIFNSYISDDEYIRTLHVKNKKPDSTEGSSGTSNKGEAKFNNLVITHGFGNGIGFYFKNYEGLTQIPGIDLYSIDWLGMGLSSRPDFSIDRKLSIEDQVKKTEEFFVESLEKWRQNMKIEKMNLLGHSFGGYMSSLYALKYPHRVNKLILESPVGVQETPKSIDEFLETGVLPKSKLLNPDPSSAEEEQEALDDSLDKTKPPKSNEQIIERFSTAPFYYRFLFKIFVRQWNNYGSPQSLMRSFGRLGPMFTSKYASKFTTLSPDEIKLLADYLFHVSAQKGSGEYSIGVILKPFAFARIPLINRLTTLQVPTYFLYGDRDWMDIDAGTELSEKIKPDSKVFKIPNAGHNMHLDNPNGFNEIVTEILSI
ncbi:putative cardiolipin-specific deacylase, mitochondrial [Smittium mucronatum]|uniref:Putative cardiolipin-specific deacylase, mitochondrial n=1 Tax=Smittium mucronatum TaxID=133383 RepID=A0A1R0GNF0_9FUNG|nr:putative cardiolipin-specific deacylase, mitochondrial [Smittium mucronatum]